MQINKFTVAIVDDDAGIARAIGRLLRASGYEVATYPSAELYLAARPGRPSNCLVLDVKLGGMSGLDLQQRLRELGDHTPIVFLTSHDVREFRERAIAAGCIAYLLKPVSSEELLSALMQALGS